MISHLGPQLAIADGVALANVLNKKDKVCLAFTGEGGTSEGDFHEALNVAAVWDLPVIFIIENNGYGLSTPVNEQYRCENLIDKARGYGMNAVQIDGNNVLTIYDTVRGVREFCIENKKPYLIECITFRMRGHEEASGTKYIPKELFEEWSTKDPVANYEMYLLQQGVLNADSVNHIREEAKRYIDEELRVDVKQIIPDTKEELKDIYWAEKHLVKTLPKMQKAATNEELQDAFADHCDQTKEQVTRLEQIFETIGEKAVAQKCVPAYGQDQPPKHRATDTAPPH